METEKERLGYDSLVNKSVPKIKTNTDEDFKGDTIENSSESLQVETFLQVINMVLIGNYNEGKPDLSFFLR